jgi:hypothetical protein
MSHRVLILCTVIMCIVQTVDGYDRVRPKDVEPNPDQLKAKLKAILDARTTRKAPMTEREKKRAAYLAQREAKRKQSKEPANPSSTSNESGYAYNPWTCKDYGDVCFGDAKVVQILGPNAVLANQFKHDGALILIEGIDTTKLTFAENTMLSVCVFALVNQARYVTANGRPKTVPLYRIIGEPLDTYEYME